MTAFKGTGAINEGRRNAHARLIETGSSALCLHQVAGTSQRVKSQWLNENKAVAQ